MEKISSTWSRMKKDGQKMEKGVCEDCHVEMEMRTIKIENYFILTSSSEKVRLVENAAKTFAKSSFFKEWS